MHLLVTLKQHFTNLCIFWYDETGIWISPLDSNDQKIGMQVDADKFRTKYYPNGIPQSVKELLQDLGAIKQ